jgi:hypothetical protein
MRDRHFPRVCPACVAPMGRQEDTCWSCGGTWDDRRATRSPRRVIGDGAAEHPDGARQSLTHAAVIGEPLVAQAQLDVDRWADEGGRVAAEASTRT